MNFGKQKRKIRKRINNEMPTKAKCNKGFSGFAKVCSPLKLFV